MLIFKDKPFPLQMWLRHIFEIKLKKQTPTQQQ